MEKLSCDIKKEYSHELNEIGYILETVEGRQRLRIKSCKMDGYLATNIKKLGIEICKLLTKIQNGEEGTATKIAKWFF